MSHLVLHKSSAHLMRKRTKARELALQILYQMDVTGEDCDTALEGYWQAQEEEHIEEELKIFATELVKGTAINLATIDQKISGYATNWQLGRMAMVDRNILRMGCYELLFRQDIPPKVSINEAVDLAKKFSGAEAGKFVNAVLDKIKSEKEKQ